MRLILKTVPERNTSTVIYVLIPVFNRLHYTKKVVQALRTQNCFQELSIVVIDDGSTDGTAEWLTQQGDITTLRGNGRLWWGGAIEYGLHHALAMGNDKDYVLFVNNDTKFDAGYVEKLREVSLSNENAIVGTALYEEGRDPPLTSIGVRMNIDEYLVRDVIDDLDAQERANPRKTYTVDAISGRGALYPITWFKLFGTMRPRLLPHYFADYEVSMRFARHGAKLIVSTETKTYSPPIHESASATMGFWQRFFSERSPNNIIRRIFFFSLVGTPWQRATALPRALAYCGRALLRLRQRQSNST